MRAWTWSASSCPTPSPRSATSPTSAPRSSPTPDRVPARPSRRTAMTTIDPTRTALIAVHLQNDIVGPDGAFAPFFRAEIDRVGTLATAARLLDAARAAGVPVVYTRVAWRPDYSDLHANSPLLNIVIQQNCLVDGTPGAAITDELAPQDADRVVTHQRVGGFHGSDLD